MKRKRHRYGISDHDVGNDGPGSEAATDVAALVRAACRGERGAQRRVLEMLLPTLRGAAQKVLGHRAEAEDATQQAAIDVLRGLPSFRGDASLYAWARTVAVRAALRQIRQGQRHLSVADPERALSDAAGPAGDPADLFPGAVRAHLDALPPRQREALLLRHGFGYTVAEVAELLEASVNTVKSRLLQGRRALRRRIRQQGLVAQARRGGEAL